MRCITLTLLCLSFLASASSVLAGETHYCDQYGVWKEISDANIARTGLQDKVRILQEAIRTVRTSDLSKRNIRVIVTDCPILGDRIHAMPIVTLADLFTAKGSSAYPKDYGIYVTLAQLRSMNEDDLAFTGRQQACLIHAGGADKKYRAFDMLTRANIECRLETAKALGQTEEARWFSRLLDDPSPEASEVTTIEIPLKLPPKPLK